MLARELGESGRVVGFMTAISDGVLSAFIPLLEVLTSGASRQRAVRRIEQRRFDMAILARARGCMPFYARFDAELLTSIVPAALLAAERGA